MPGSTLRVVAARVVAGVSALLWGVLNFGVVDLLTGLLRDPVFSEHWVLEIGWGLLYLVLVAVPFAALVVRPGTGLWVAGLGVVAVSLALAAVVSGKSGHLVPAAAIAVAASVVGWLGHARPPQLARRPSVVALVVALAGAVPWGWYAVTTARSLFNDEITNGLTHYPAQGALGFALLLGSLLLAVTDPATPGRPLLVVTVTLAGFTLGVESVVNPDLVGSLGVTGGLVAALWSAALLVGVLLPAHDGAAARGGHDQQ